MKKLICILGVILLFLFSCISQKKILDSWIGATKQNLVISWGPPSRTYDNSPNGEILIYAQQGYWPGYGNSPGFAYWDYTYIYINTTGRIYAWKTERQRVPPQQIDLYIRNY
ncbi:MAG TPA: hypothetical protein VIH57_19235 [Bacteroidales bacterium]